MLTKPVVLMKLTTWKAAWWSASPAPIRPFEKRFMATRTVLASTMMQYSLNSPSRNILFGSPSRTLKKSEKLTPARNMKTMHTMSTYIEP